MALFPHELKLETLFEEQGLLCLFLDGETGRPGSNFSLRAEIEILTPGGQGSYEHQMTRPKGSEKSRVDEETSACILSPERPSLQDPYSLLTGCGDTGFSRSLPWLL